jgi:hypothetical protein
LFKDTGSDYNWQILDNMRSFDVSGGSYLYPNLQSAESSSAAGALAPSATGFYARPSQLLPSTTFIYIAIRRGPMKTPTDATKVFSPNNVANSGASTVTTGFPVDMMIDMPRTTATVGAYLTDRLRGGGTALFPPSTSAESAGSLPTTQFQSNTTVGGGIGFYPEIYWNFRRAPGYFDVCCYTGNGGSNTLSHNLGTTPQMAIVKSRSAASSAGWFVNIPLAGTNNVGYLNLTNSFANSGAMLMNSTSFSYAAGFADLNASGTTYVAYLFATCHGVSKVGSYTGNGTTQAIACGFTGGARFVLIKATSTTGDWLTFDTARGMTVLTDPVLSLNSTAAETATLGACTTTTGGFTVNEAILAGVNTSGVSFVFLAIA